MIGKIKYSYIPRNNTIDAILSSLAYAIKATGAYNYKLIDNSSSGIRIYPDEIKDSVIRCSSNDLLETINKLTEDIDLEIIIINDFDISLDDLRSTYCKIVKNNDLLLCINNLKELANENSNISIVIDPEIADLDEEEWLETKEDILFNLNDAQEKSTKKTIKTLFNNDINDDADDSNNLSDSLLKLFGLDVLYDENKKSKLLSPSEDEVDIQEQYCHATKETELFVSLTTNGEIVIDCNNDIVIIPKEQIEFLIDALGKLI